ncbi:MAG: PEP-CTERM sorting domain-containing protein [Chthoniobacterales bacterium]
MQYIGANDGLDHSNSYGGFTWESTGPVSSIQPYTDFTPPFDHNYSIYFRVSQIPEPSTAALFALAATGIFLARRNLGEKTF